MRCGINFLSRIVIDDRWLYYFNFDISFWAFFIFERSPTPNWLLWSEDTSLVNYLFWFFVFPVDVGQNYVLLILPMDSIKEIDMSIAPTKIGMATFRWLALSVSKWSAIRGVIKLLRELPILGKLRHIPSTILITNSLQIASLA